jgi:hypothetical protein
VADLIPFDPSKHKKISLPGGRYATEYLASESSPEGGAWNIPQIWFDSETASYEERTGKKFPRFPSIDEAVEAAKKRSKAGGASKKSLLKKND